MFYTQKYYLQNSTSSPNIVATRVGIFLGLDFTINLTQELNTNKYLSTIPAFSFSSDYTKVLIDYSNSQNNTDISLLNGLFSGLTAGFTFTINTAIYSLDGSESNANLGGTYEFEDFVGNVIIASPITINNLNKRILRYESNYFTNPPQFGLSLSPQKDEPEYIIINALAKDKTSSFTKFGIYPKDKIKITGTQLNNKTYTVNDVFTNKDGSEYLSIEEPVTQEATFGLRVGIELLQERKGTDSITTATGPAVIGACGIYQNNNKVACYENQTFDQCQVRMTLFDNSSMRWFENTSCDELSSSIEIPRTTRFVGPSAVTNPYSSLAGLGYFGSGNSVNL